MLAPILVRKLKSASAAHGENGRHAQTENEDREQQNAAPDTRHSDEGPDSKTHQAFDQQIHDSNAVSSYQFRHHRERV